VKYERFEDTPVWNAAADLAARIFRWTNQRVFRGKGDLANQLQRAALSISNNIAGGFERGTTNELITFLYYARGSAGEVRSMLSVIERMLRPEGSGGLSELPDFKREIPDARAFRAEITRLKAQCESIARQIRGWTASLQNSDIPGQRHLTDQTRESYQRK
jgi:four helix bundle protein